MFYYLRELDEALNYALGAGTAFDITDQSEYVSAIIGAPLRSPPAAESGRCANLSTAR